jgi:hypothetical protein
VISSGTMSLTGLLFHPTLSSVFENTILGAAFQTRANSTRKPGPRSSPPESASRRP